MFQFLLENEDYLPFTLRPISNDMATLSTSGRLDFEAKPIYHVVVKVTDLVHSRGERFISFDVVVSTIMPDFLKINTFFYWSQQKNIFLSCMNSSI